MNANATRLRDGVKKELEIITQQNPTSKLKISRELQAGLRAQPDYTAHEFADILNSSYVYKTVIVRVIRKKLTIYSVTLNNLAHKTYQTRSKISALAV